MTFPNPNCSTSIRGGGRFCHTLKHSADHMFDRQPQEGDSYCVKDAAGHVHGEGKIGATRRELDAWIRTLPQPLADHGIAKAKDKQCRLCEVSVFVCGELCAGNHSKHLDLNVRPGRKALAIYRYAFKSFQPVRVKVDVPKATREQRFRINERSKIKCIIALETRRAGGNTLPGSY